MSDLTPDNPSLSKPTTGSPTERTDLPATVPIVDQKGVHATNSLQISNDLAGKVEQLVEAGIADATHRAYRADLAHFTAWGGKLPAEPATVAAYIAAHTDSLSVATLVRRLAKISKAHSPRGFPSPCRSELVRATLRGVRRVRGVKQREATPLIRDDLFRVLDAIGDGVRDARDRALLLIGFAGGFRRSELGAIDFFNLQSARQGLVVHIRRSKTDRGRWPQGRHPTRPIPSLPGSGS